MHDKASLLAFAESMNCKVEITDYAINVDAPKGQLFASNFTHTIHVPCASNGESWRRAAYRDAIQQLSHGLTSCDEPNCDVCEEK